MHAWPHGKHLSPQRGCVVRGCMATQGLAPLPSQLASTGPATSCGALCMARRTVHRKVHRTVRDTCCCCTQQCMARPRPTWEPAAAQAGLRALFSLRRCSRRAAASRARAFLALPRPGNGSGSQGVTVVSETRRAGERSASGSGTGGGGVGSGGGELCKHVGTGSVASARKANTPSRLPRAPQTGSSPRAASP